MLSESRGMAKFIFVTGGVVSSLGKGIAAASIGCLLEARGLKVNLQKFDPYLNVDPGTMSPFQHGEVFVTDDGAETDLDLGHYERFTHAHLTQLNNLTSGRIYESIIQKERRGDYLGKTVQVIPHVTDEIKMAARRLAKDSDVVIVEIGGTVGDIESLPFLEALRQLRTDLGRDNTFYVHVTWLPYIAATAELKTKPTQHSVRELRSIGISPDMIVARSDHPVDASLREKMALFCDVDKRAVIPMVTAEVLYEVPLLIEAEGMADYILERMGLTARARPDWSEWRWLVDEVRREKPSVRVALVGKYVELHDAYISVREALKHAALHLGVELDLQWVHSADLEKGRSWDVLESVSGVLVPGGFGSRGIEGKIQAAHYARTHQVPYFGLCLGMQLMVTEFAREILGDDQANSTEFDRATPHPVIDLMPDQRTISDMGGTMRLGLYPCELQPGTIAAEAYQETQVEERHRHRFEFNNAYREAFAAKGMRFSGLSPDGRLVEIVELADHPFMLATQFHPEFLSRPNRPHPLFLAFIRAACDRAGIPYRA